MVVKIDVQKTRSGLFWTNRYLVDVATIGEVTGDMITAITAFEGPIHSTAVSFVSARVSDLEPNTDNFFVVPLSGTGGTSDGGNPIPGFNTLRIDFGVGVGRPLRKYLRVFVGEAQTVGQSWLTDYVTDSQALALSLIDDLPELCDPQGNRAFTVAVKNLIQMRQIRRGSRRRTEPVIPVA